MDTDKRPIYPIQVWDITETEFDIKNNYRNETTFALSNGYIGTRGTFEEAYDFDIDTGLEGKAKVGKMIFVMARRNFCNVIVGAVTRRDRHFTLCIY